MVPQAAVTTGRRRHAVGGSCAAAGWCRRRSGLCLEPLDPVGQATDLSLELEGTNQSDDGNEDPEEDDQRSQYPEHRVLDEMLARKQSGASLYGSRKLILR